MEWGEYRLGDLFEKIKIKTPKYKTSELPDTPTNQYNLPALTAGIQNQGLNNYVPREGATILKNVISISANGANTGATFFQSKEFTVLQDAYAIRWLGEEQLTNNMYLFLTSSISQAIYGSYEWTNKAGWERIKNDLIHLPISKGSIDFAFMERFICELNAARLSELNAYFLVTGLKDYVLTSQEQQALEDFEKDLIWREESFSSIFNQIKQGRRLKKEDQKPGRIPFVMAGISNTGVINYVSNPVVTFPRNSITIDIFGNTFYRNYSYGAGDDTGAYWNTEKSYSKELMLFFATSMGRALFGKFSYGKKLRSSQSLDFRMFLPSSNGKPDYAYMETLISAIQKLVIRDVVDFADREIKATEKVIQGA